jgi:hypothetical protein
MADMPASGCLNANTHVAFLVPPTLTICATRNAPDNVENAAVIASVKSRAGNLAHPVWNRANGAVPTNHALWYAAQ